MRLRLAPFALWVTVSMSLIACTPGLPEPESAEAKLYSNRCGGCHRLYPPSVMTAATWQVMLERMQGEMRRRGFPPLSKEETAMVYGYLSRHAHNAQQGAPQ